MKTGLMMERINIYIYFAKPDLNNLLQVTDFEKNSLKKEIKNEIYKEACLFNMVIVNKHFKIRTFDCTDNQYKTTFDVYKFCLVSLYIFCNKETSENY